MVWENVLVFLIKLMPHTSLLETESDEQLQELLRQYLSNIDEQNERQEELDMTRSGVEAELSMIDSDLSKRLTERGQFQAEANVSPSCFENRLHRLIFR